jgi:hypothetical protein
MKYALSAGEEINLIDEDDSRRPKISSIIPSTKIRTICSDLFLPTQRNREMPEQAKGGEASPPDAASGAGMRRQKTFIKTHFHRDR